VALRQVQAAGEVLPLHAEADSHDARLRGRRGGGSQQGAAHALATPKGGNADRQLRNIRGDEAVAPIVGQ
jgi:hypothetical protein